MHLANQSSGKLDKLSQDAHKQTSYPRVQWGDTLDKREDTDPRGNPNNRRIQEELRSRTEGMLGQGTIKNIRLPMLQEARN